jgi:hypothetical protein
MPEELLRPRMLAPILVAIYTAVGAFIAAFATRKFPLLFITAGALWVASLFLAYRKWWPGIRPFPGRRKFIRGIAAFVGFLFFWGAWRIIVWLDPSLK